MWVVRRSVAALRRIVRDGINDEERLVSAITLSADNDAAASRSMTPLRSGMQIRSVAEMTSEKSLAGLSLNFCATRQYEIWNRHGQEVRRPASNNKKEGHVLSRVPESRKRKERERPTKSKRAQKSRRQDSGCSRWTLEKEPNQHVPERCRAIDV